MEFDDWRFNLRSSNTEPLVRLNVESRGDRPLMESRTAELLELIGGEEGMDALIGTAELKPEQSEQIDAGATVVLSYGARGLGTFWLKLWRDATGLALVVWPGDNLPAEEEESCCETR